MVNGENAVEEKSFEFAVRIVNLVKYIRNKDKEFVLTKQLLRCGTSIGANVAEGQRAQSKADFYAKMSIALKEANETDYWLRLLCRTDYISQKEYESMEKVADELIRILVAICKTASESRK